MDTFFSNEFLDMLVCFLICVLVVWIIIDRFYSAKSKQIVEDSYRGSLPAFIAAFADGNALSNQEILEIQELIDTYKRNNNL